MPEDLRFEETGTPFGLVAIRYGTVKNTALDFTKRISNGSSIPYLLLRYRDDDPAEVPWTVSPMTD